MRQKPCLKRGGSNAVSNGDEEEEDREEPISNLMADTEVKGRPRNSQTEFLERQNARAEISVGQNEAEGCGSEQNNCSGAL